MGRLARVTVVAVVLAVLFAGCDWAQFSSGPGHVNANPFEPKFTVSSGAQFATAWSTSCTCLAPLEAGGLVYVADGYGGVNPRTVTLRALDGTTGTQRWSFVFTQIDAAEFLAVGDGLAYVVLHRTTHPDAILGLDATTGALRWAVTPPGPANEFAVGHQNVVLDGALLFVGADDTTQSTVSAIDTAGQIVWSVNPPGTLDGIAADPGGSLYVSSHVTVTNPPYAIAFLAGYAETDRTRRSIVEVPSQPGAAFAFANGLAYLGSMAMRPDSGQIVWNALGERVFVIAGTVVLTVSGLDVIARDATTGVLLWRAVGAAPTAAGETIATGGSLLFVAHPHVIDILSLQDGSLLGATPSVSMDVDLIPANGHLYVDGAATLWAFAPIPT